MPNEVFDIKVSALRRDLHRKMNHCIVNETDKINIVDAFNDACVGLEDAIIEGEMESGERHAALAYIQKGRRYISQLYLNS